MAVCCLVFDSLCCAACDEAMYQALGFNTSLGTNDGFGDFLNTLVLANDSLMKNLVQM